MCVDVVVPRTLARVSDPQRWSYWNYRDEQ